MVEDLLDLEFEVVSPIRPALEQVRNSGPAPKMTAERSDSQNSTVSLPNSAIGLKSPASSFRTTALDTALCMSPYLTR